MRGAAARRAIWWLLDGNVYGDKYLWVVDDSFLSFSELGVF
jgi:hypothetical protein